MLNRLEQSKFASLRDADKWVEKTIDVAKMARRSLKYIAVGALCIAADRTLIGDDQSTPNYETNTYNCPAEKTVTMPNGSDATTHLSVNKKIQFNPQADVEAVRVMITNEGKVGLLCYVPESANPAVIEE